MRFLAIVCMAMALSCSSENDPDKKFIDKRELPAIPEPKIVFNPQQYVCYQSDQPLTIDGKMEESIWIRAPWTKDFVDIEGELKPLPRFKTRVKMLWDKDYFYIFAELEETDVWAKLTQRDTVIFYDNDFEVFIDPNGDTHRYYELEINAFNTAWDLFLDRPYRDNGRPLFYWNIDGLKSSVSVDGTINQPGDRDKGWNLEIALPWKVLKECAEKEAPPADGDQWRVNFSRVEWQVEVKDGRYRKLINPQTGKSFPEDNWVWSAQGIINMHYPEMWGFVQFSEEIAGSAEVKFNQLEEEYAKWILRMVYYRQKNYYKKEGKFANDVTVLNLENYKVEGYAWPPQIQTTPSQFEAVLKSITNKGNWHISQSGEIWRN